MKKIKVLQQVLNPSGSGGVSTEFRALQQSKLAEVYEFVPMILMESHRGLNRHDIGFYYRAIKRERPDIVHVRGAAIDGLNAEIAARLAGCGKVLVTVHGMYSDMVYYPGWKKWISKHIIERLVFQLAGGISCVCRTAMERPYFDRYREKMLPFVYNRMPTFDRSRQAEYRKAVRQAYGIPETDTVALYLGGMSREKGLDVLAESLRTFSTWPANLTVLMVGGGAYRAAMERMCREISPKIVFTGDQRDIQRFYAAGDFFIQPSLHENHSIAILEACAAGLPCVVTDCGGNAETVTDGVTGVVVPVGDSKALADGIRTMLDRKRRAEFRHQVETADFSRFSNEAADAALGEVYQKLLEREIK